MIPKILIADDDVFSRKLLRGILRAVPCTLTEAVDGLEALASIDRDPPDLLLLDVRMPMLDGLATLQEIRASPVHARLPVISVSSNTEREMVMALLELGLAGFLVKPLKPAETLRRLAPVLAAVGRPRDSLLGAMTSEGKPRRARLMLADSDPNFRQHARQLLDPHFEVLEAATGVAALAMFREEEPDIVCVAEHIQMLGVERLVPLLHAAESRVVPRIYLLSESGCIPHFQEVLLSGVICRTFVPEVFEREIRAALLASDPVGATVASLMRGPIRGELTTAVHQAVGVLTSQQLIAVGVDAPLTSPVVLARVELAAGTGSTVVAVQLELADADAVTFGRRILGEAPEGDAREAVKELVTAIAGRACASLCMRGFRFVQRPPVLVAAVQATTTSPDSLAFRTAAGELLHVSVSVVDVSQPRPGMAAA